MHLYHIGIISTESWERTCDIQQLVFYHAGSDSYIGQSNETIYSYKRCSLDEIIARAEEALGSFELTDDQKEYYGLE